MKNNFLNKSVANIYFKPSPNSEVVSQILYGEKFKILLKRKKYNHEIFATPTFNDTCKKKLHNLRKEKYHKWKFE